MAKQDKVITYAYLKEECDLPRHLPDDELESKIYRAQETLRMILCEEFYNDYVFHYKEKTLPDSYVTLQPYIDQYIAWQAHAYWTIKTNFKYTRGGIRVHSEENSTAASDVQLGILIKDANYQAEYYKRLLVSFIETHSSDYPLYCSCGSNKTGNFFHMSAVRNRHKAPQPYGLRHHATCNCGCHD